MATWTEQDADLGACTKGKIKVLGLTRQEAAQLISDLACALGDTNLPGQAAGVSSYTIKQDGEVFVVAIGLQRDQ